MFIAKVLVGPSKQMKQIIQIEQQFQLRQFHLCIEITNKGKHAGSLNFCRFLKHELELTIKVLSLLTILAIFHLQFRQTRVETLSKEGGVIAKLALIGSGCKIFSFINFIFISFSWSKGPGLGLGLVLLTCWKDNLKGRTCVGKTT